MAPPLLDLPRSSGILLHPTSLPGPGIGDLGSAAYRWVDWLVGAGQSLWQILPLVPVGPGGSPYNGHSAMAGNPLLISPERLRQEGLVAGAELEGGERDGEPVNFPRVIAWKSRLLRQAHAAFRRGVAPELRQEFTAFREHTAHWLEDFVLFLAVQEHQDGACWTDWDPAIRDRQPQALAHWRSRLAAEIEQHTFAQFLFERQWQALRRYARERGVRIIGDIPIFVDHDSADVWAHRELFRLDSTGRPEVVSGVPPDYFSETGQRWGNPLYRWEVMAEQDYGWWTDRFRRTLELVDIARIDHFRGFEAYWEIPVAAETAIDGRWVPGPGPALFAAVEHELGELPLIAEDLGLITPEVDALREALGFPGMRVLQFAFDGNPRNPHLPENHPRNAVSYTGTHDNDTAVGWWQKADPAQQTRFRQYAGGDGREVHWEMIRLALESAAHFALVPLQDVIGLGSEARMNTPGLGAGSWQWRFGPTGLAGPAQERLLELTRASHRRPPAVQRSGHPQQAEGVA